MEDSAARELRLLARETVTMDCEIWTKRGKLIGRKKMGLRTRGLDEVEQVNVGSTGRVVVQGHHR